MLDQDTLIEQSAGKFWLSTYNVICNSWRRPLPLHSTAFHVDISWLYLYHVTLASV